MQKMFILQVDTFLNTVLTSYKSPTSYSSSVSKGFQPKFTPKLIQSSQHAQSSQGEPKPQKDYKAKYKKMKAKLALLKASPPPSRSSKPFQSKNKGLVAETFDWDEEEVYDDEEETQVKVLMALTDDTLHWQNYLKYIHIDLKYIEEQRLNLLSKYTKIVFELNKCRDDLLILKQAKLEAVTFQIQNTELTKLNHALQDQLSRIHHPKNNAKDNPFVPASLDYDHEMVPKSKYWVERLNPHSKLPNFNTGRILVLKGASPSSEVMTLIYQDHSLRERSGLGTIKHKKPKTQESSNKNISGRVTVYNPELVTSLVPTKVKTNDQESKINELTKQMVENQNGFKVKKSEWIRTEFRNCELENFYDEKGISQNFSSPYTPEQNGVAERKNRTLIEAARTMLNGSVLSKHFWTDAVRIACYTQNRSIIVKRHDKTSYEIFRERIPDISYFHVFGCPVFIHNHKDHLGKFDAKADDGYFLGYSSVSKAFRVYNTRRQQIEETYHVTFDESMEAIRFTNTSVDEIGIDDSSRYPPDESQEDDPSRQYQVDSDFLYYIIPHGRSLTEITQENHVPEVISPNEPEIPHTEDDEGPPDQINTEGTHEQNVQNDHSTH
ncbi:retrovirus-related pol polyprotein from transposon TNT 1-94 [Tanacetum coccineum]